MKISNHGPSFGPLALAALAVTAPLPAQESAVIDEGTFVITEGESVTGQEEFQVRRGRAGASDGFTVTTTATYPPSQPTRTITVRLELGADSQPVAAEIRERSDVQRGVVMAFRPRRITVRVVTPGGESVREHPRGARTLLLASGVFGIFAVLPTGAAGEVSAITPSGERPVRIGFSDHGIERIRVKGVDRALRHLSLQHDNEIVHLWFDERGRLIQATIPDRNVKAVRNHS